MSKRIPYDEFCNRMQMARLRITLDLLHILHRIQTNMLLHPEDYSEGPIDIRLAVDEDGLWTIWTGSSEYDTYHPAFCGGSVVTLETTATGLAMELIDEVLQQHASRGDV